MPFRFSWKNSCRPEPKTTPASSSSSKTREVSNVWDQRHPSGPALSECPLNVLVKVIGIDPGTETSTSEKAIAPVVVSIPSPAVRLKGSDRCSRAVLSAIE